MNDRDRIKYIQEAHRMEYATVASVWQSIQRERFFLAGTVFTVAGILIGAFASGVRLIGVLDENRTMAVLVPAIPVIGMMLSVVAWVTDVYLQKCQRIARTRGAELERLLGVERGLFTQAYTWRMPIILRVQLREIIGLLMVGTCFVAYAWTYSSGRARETTVTKTITQERVEEPRPCACNCDCRHILTPSYPRSIIPDGKD